MLQEYEHRMRTPRESYQEWQWRRAMVDVSAHAGICLPALYRKSEMKLCGLVPVSYIHISANDLYMYSQDRSAYLAAAK